MTEAPSMIDAVAVPDAALPAGIAVITGGPTTALLASLSGQRRRKAVPTREIAQ
ncbi:MAG: hypothetical protein ACRDOI_25995 [Trebonia sp.]